MKTSRFADQFDVKSPAQTSDFQHRAQLRLRPRRARLFQLRRPRAYNVLAVVPQGETRADFFEKSIRKTGRHVRGAQ